METKEEKKPPPKKWTTRQKIGLGLIAYGATEMAFNHYMRNVHDGINYQIPLSNYPFIMVQAYRHKLSQSDIQQIGKMLSGRHPFRSWDDDT